MVGATPSSKPHRQQHRDHDDKRHHERTYHQCPDWIGHAERSHTRRVCAVYQHSIETALRQRPGVTLPSVVHQPAAVVVDYDPSWPAAFERVRALVWPVVEETALAIEHIGSTSVEGLAAKPIVDVDVVVAHESNVPTAVAALETLGYHHEGDLGVPGREAFVQPEGLPEHHLYVVVQGSQPHRDHVDFRNYLRANPATAARYANEKRRLAHLLASDRDAYVSGKASLVQEVLASARER